MTVLSWWNVREKIKMTQSHSHGSGCVMWLNLKMCQKFSLWGNKTIEIMWCEKPKS